MDDTTLTLVALLVTVLGLSALCLETLWQEFAHRMWRTWPPHR